MSMAADGVSSKNPALGWPGDLKANGRITTVADFVNVLVRNDYFKPDDLVFFSNTGFKSFFPNTGYKPYRGVLSSGSNGVLVPAFTEENCAFKVYLVKDADSSNTVFLASKNYIYNTPLNNPNAKPFGVNGFVVCRKGGDVSILKKEQAQSLQVNQPGSSYYVGQLPGGGTVENAANCLNPGQ